MKKTKRIGFFHSDEDQEEESKEKVHPFKTFIEGNYSPNGFDEQLEMYTTKELVYKMSEMFTISESNLNEILTELGYEIKTIDNEALWMLFNQKRLSD